MKKFLLLTVAALGIFVACEKDEFEALDAAFAQEINRLDAADDVLQSNIDDLTSAFNAFVEDINNRLAEAVAALEAADDALEAYINSEIDELSDKLDAYVAELNKSIKENTDLIKATGTELRLKIEAEAAARLVGDLELENELAEQVAKLDSIDERNLQLIYGNLRSISAANARITAEAQASVARDAVLQSGIDSNTLAISAVASRTATLEASVATNVADINQNLLDIASNDGEILAHNTRIGELRTELDAAVVAANTLRGRVDLLNSHAGRISTLEAEVAALELAVAAQGETDGTHASTLTTIQTSITNLRGSLEQFATDGDTAVSNAIGLEITRIDGLLAGLRTDVDANAAQLVWQNGLIAGLTLEVVGLQDGAVTASASGTILTLTVSGTTYTIDQTGGLDGATGQRGAVGPQGPIGPQGIPGTNGNAGGSGTSGSNGADGVGITSATYDAATGILRLNFSDNTFFETGDLRGPAGSGSGNGVALIWSPSFDDATVAQKTNVANGYTQTSNLEGAELSRDVTVTSSNNEVRNVPAAELFYIGTVSYTTQDLAEAAAQDAANASNDYTAVNIEGVITSVDYSDVTYISTANGVEIGRYVDVDEDGVAGEVTRRDIGFTPQDSRVFNPATVTSWTPAFGTQEADFPQSGTDGQGLTGQRTISVTASSTTVYEYRITTGGERTTRGYASQELAVAAANAIAGDRNVQIYISSRTSTFFVASHGLGSSTPVPGSYEAAIDYINPGYSAPVDSGVDGVDFTGIDFGPAFDPVGVAAHRGTSFTQSRTGVVSQVGILDGPGNAQNPTAPNLVQNREVTIASGAQTFYAYRLGTSGTVTGFTYSGSSQAIDAANTAAGTDNVQIYIFSVLRTTYTATAEGGIALGAIPVDGLAQAHSDYINPGYDSTPFDSYDWRLDETTRTWTWTMIGTSDSATNMDASTVAPTPSNLYRLVGTYVAGASSIVEELIPTQPQLGPDVWTEANGVYTNPHHADVSFTSVQLGVIVRFVAPDGVAQAVVTSPAALSSTSVDNGDGTFTSSVQTANGDDTLADLISFIESLL